MPESRKCSRCGAELSSDAPGGHCLACLLQLGLALGETSPEEVAAGILPASEVGILPPVASLAEKPGDRIGRYKLLQQIGEGGCGVVYMAEQEEPVHRRVALKIIKLGMDTRNVIARFEAERQALAMMDHPNIAKVFDAGATDSPHNVAQSSPPASSPGVSPGLGPGGGTPPKPAGGDACATLSAGRPYFVMELVRGVKITTYCDEQKLSTRLRLDLFIQVCQAVQHAHQKGIIHRDLKPSNILVTEQDGAPMPKIIDFGIAKATTDQRLTDKTLFTAFEQFVGTPAYMSPEQAGLGGLDIDTRSDIYSLGVLLYELLTGRTPFDAKELIQAGLDEMRRTIREKEPARPSTRVTELVAADVRRLTTLSEKDRASSRRLLQKKERLVSQLRGDLDWIVMKCLEKDRARRYETANGLAMDIQRHLYNEPVVARPPSNLYRLQKLVRRNKLLFATAIAVVVALLIGLGLSTLMFIRERDATRRAVVGEKKAEHEAAKSETEANRARRAEADAKDKLWDSYLAQAQARRWSGRMGRRFESLEALRKAAEIRPSLQLRNEAIACMALPDFRVIKEWQAKISDRVMIAFDGDYKRYAITDLANKRPISLRRVEDDQELLALPCPGSRINGLHFDPEGRYLGVICKNGGEAWHLQLFDLFQERTPWQFTNIDCRTFSFSPDGRRLAVAQFHSKPILLYDLERRQQVSSFEYQPLPQELSFSPAGDKLAVSGTDGNSVEIRDVENGKVLQSFSHPATVYGLDWHPGGSLIAAACDDGRIYLWEIATAKTRAILSGHQMAPQAVKFTHSGEFLLSAGWDATIRLWNPLRAQQLLSLPSISWGLWGFAPDDTRVAFGNCIGDRASTLFQFAPARECRRLAAMNSEARTFMSVLSRDGKWLAAVSYDGARLWNMATAQEVLFMPVDQYYTGHFVAFDPKGERLFACSQFGLYAWPLVHHPAGQESTNQADLHQLRLGAPVLLSPTAPVDGFNLSASGEILAYAQAGIVIVLHLSDTKRVGSLQGPRPYDLVALSPDGRLAAAWQWQAPNVDVWEVAGARKVKSLLIPTPPTCVFAPDGQWLITGDETGYRFWSTTDWQCHRCLPREGSPRFRGFMALPLHGRVVAMAHSRNSIRLVSTVSGEELATLEAPDSEMINSLSFDAVGDRLAASVLPHDTIVWDLHLIRQQLARMNLDW